MVLWLEVVNNVPDRSLPVTENKGPPRHLRLLVEYAVLPADPPVPVRRKLERELRQSCVENTQGRLMVHRYGHHLHPQTLEVFVSLPQQYELARSHRCKSHGEERKQKRAPFQVCQTDHAAGGGQGEVGRGHARSSQSHGITSEALSISFPVFARLSPTMQRARAATAARAPSYQVQSV